MKELPYFRFTPSEWQNGKISLEDYELQGFFIQVCSYYWISDCSITLAMLSKRYKYDKALIEQCLNLGIFEHDIETDFITISFLNEQFDTLSEARKRRQSAGSKGGTKKSENYSNATTKPKQSHNYKDKDKDKYKDNIEIDNISPPTTFLKNIIPIDELKEHMLSQDKWIEDFARINKLGSTYEEAINKAKEFVGLFVEKLKADNEKGWDKDDCFRYCNNVTKLYLKNGKTTAKDFNGNGSTGNGTGNTENLAAKRPISSAI